MLERLDHSFDGQRPASAEVRQLGETLLEINARHERLI
jgi:hypothetical protein